MNAGWGGGETLGLGVPCLGDASVTIHNNAPIIIAITPANLINAGPVKNESAIHLGATVLFMARLKADIFSGKTTWIAFIIRITIPRATTR